MLRKLELIAAIAVAAGMSVSLLGCTSAPTAPAGRASHPAQPVSMAGARHCPVTIGHPVPSSMPWRDLLFGWSSAYGNRSLWVGGLSTHGVVIITPDNVDPDGRLGMKFGWYMLTGGHLTITGQRLDAPAPPSSGQAFSGYGPGFSSSGVIFPTEGCWQVTGRVGKTALTFVTFVIKGHCDLSAVLMRCAADHAR
jgi:hypothetical protein